MEFIHNSPNIKTFKTPKSIRTIPILNPLMPYLEKQFRGKKKGDIVFCNYKGEIYDKARVQRLFGNFNKDYNEYMQENILHITMHQFRHIF